MGRDAAVGVDGQLADDAAIVAALARRVRAAHGDHVLAARVDVQRHVDRHGDAASWPSSRRSLPFTNTSHSLSAVILRCDVSVAFIGIVPHAAGISGARIDRRPPGLKRRPARHPSRARDPRPRPSARRRRPYPRDPRPRCPRGPRPRPSRRPERRRRRRCRWRPGRLPLQAPPSAPIARRPIQTRAPWPIVRDVRRSPEHAQLLERRRAHRRVGIAHLLQQDVALHA